MGDGALSDPGEFSLVSLKKVVFSVHVLNISDL